LGCRQNDPERLSHKATRPGWPAIPACSIRLGWAADISSRPSAIVASISFLDLSLRVVDPANNFAPTSECSRRIRVGYIFGVIGNRKVNPRALVDNQSNIVCGAPSVIFGHILAGYPARRSAARHRRRYNSITQQRIADADVENKSVPILKRPTDFDRLLVAQHRLTCSAGRDTSILVALQTAAQSARAKGGNDLGRLARPQLVFVHGNG
jgi:hypothetical protein